MVNILYVVRALPVKQSKGVQISLFTPIYASVVKMDLSRNATNVEFGVRILTEAPLNGLFDNQLSHLAFIQE